MSLAPSVHLVFGQGGTALRHLVAGWSVPEPGFCWTLGTGASLRTNLPPGSGDPFLELAVNPHVAPTGSKRRLTVRVNGVVVGEDFLSGEGTLGYALPPASIPGDGTLTVQIEHDELHSPAELGLSADTRRLGFMLRTLDLLRVPPKPRADVTVLPPLPVPEARDAMGRLIEGVTGHDPRGLALCFESLGHNCEFGMFQRHLKAEPISLLRFAGITLDAVVAGMARGFEGAGEEVVVRAHPAHGGLEEFLVHDDRYRFGLHSFQTTADATAEEVKAQHMERLKRARRQFALWLKTGKRLFIFQRPGQITRAHALPLLHRLQSFGPNALLYVDQDGGRESGMPSGAVAQVGHGLYHGKLARMAPAHDVGDLDVSGWLGLCANAYRLWRPYRDKFVVS